MQIISVYDNIKFALKILFQLLVYKYVINIQQNAI